MTTTATAALSAPPADWLEAYSPAPGRFDEFKSPDGNIRPAWQTLARALRTLTAEELARRAENLRRLIQENGVTYNVYGETGQSARPWGMDLLPMILEWDEFQRIEAALRQRVQVINLALHDCYGPQKLLEQGVLPPELVLGNPAFLRPCHGRSPADGVWVNVYGADLARSPDGKWWVLTDRVDAPSGIGYALENRALTTRVVSDWLREERAERLDGFFERMRTAFEKLVTRRTENPRLVLLTPGPANETYFEHSYLARNQGFALVEGGDLTVRGGQVCLKTLGGLQPVDLILRRLDADFCDPLELRADSLLGVPGLVQAVRQGHVTMANSLGAGLLESPGLSPFLPALCRHFLGEEMKMSSVATWWCGQPRELAYVLEHIGELIILPAFPRLGRASVVGPKLSAAERERWRERLRAEPAAWCARERVALATTPMLEKGRLAPRLFHCRTFLVADGGEYHAMPGGLTRIPAEADDLSVSMQHGGLGKDTWVLPPPTSAAPVEITAPAGTVTLRRRTLDLPSRTADNLYWLGRYLERADGQARVLRLLAEALAAEGARADATALLPFFHSLLFGPPAAPLASGDPPALNLPVAEASLRSLLWEPTYPSSLAANLARLEATAYRVKERLSFDTWKLLGRLARPPRPAGHSGAGDAYGELAETIAQLAAVSGLLMENTTRGYGWIFMDLGRRIERGLHTAALLERTLSQPGAPAPARLQNLLVACDSLLTYRRRYLTHLHLAAVLDLLVCDESNPRSLAFQLRAVHKRVRGLPFPDPDSPPGTPERLALSLYSQAGLADARLLAGDDAGGRRSALAAFLTAVVRDLTRLSDALGQVYFAHADTGV